MAHSSLTYEPSVSVIIPLYVISQRFFQDLKYFEKLQYSNFEIIIVCDKKVKLPKLAKKTTLLLTNKKHTGPAEKRDIALKYAKSDICAFIDDDAYPEKKWLKNAIRNFRKKDIVAVGGPGVTPPDDTFWQKIGGYIVESYLCSGGIQYRFYKAKSKLFVNDYPAYNLLVRKDILKKVGGYDSTFYGGEDTLLCLKLIGYGKIMYDPRVVVFHHRRSFPFYFLVQIGRVGLHRGYFFKKYPETSRTIFYLLPTTLTSGFLGGILLSFMHPKAFLAPFLTLFLFFLTLGILSVYRHKVGLFPSLIAGVGIVLTHITYGVFFVEGIFTERLSF